MAEVPAKRLCSFTDGGRDTERDGDSVSGPDYSINPPGYVDLESPAFGTAAELDDGSAESDFGNHIGVGALNALSLEQLDLPVDASSDAHGGPNVLGDRVVAHLVG